MNILVTGGAGFIGSALVDRMLAEGHRVEVVDNLSTASLGNLAAARRDGDGRLKIHQADVRDAAVIDLIERRRPDVVFHLAASTDRTDPVAAGDAAAIDVVGTVNVLEGAVAAGVSKVVVVGRARGVVSADTRAAVRQMAIDLVTLARQHHGLEHTVVVLPTVYGPRQRPGRESGVVATFAHRLVQGLPCVIHGDGEQSRDLLYIDDAVDALTKAATKGDGLSIEVGTGTQTSIRSLHRAMASIVDVDDDPVPGAPRPGEPGTVAVDPARAHLYLGWAPFTPLAEGLTDTIASIQD